MASITSLIGSSSSSTYRKVIEDKIKIDKDDYYYLDDIFQIRKVRPLTEVEQNKKRECLSVVHTLLPSSFIDPESIGLSRSTFEKIFPPLHFTAEEVYMFLKGPLKREEISIFPVFLTGGAVRYCLANRPYNDVDCNVFIEKSDFSYILNILKTFIQYKLEGIRDSLFYSDIAPERLSHIIDTVYFYNKVQLPPKNPPYVASFIGLGTLQLKFIHSSLYRYFVANYEGFLIPLNGDHLCFVNQSLSYSPLDAERAFQDLLEQNYVVERPHEIHGLFFRIIHALTPGRDIYKQPGLIEIALNKFCEEYPIGEWSNEKFKLKVQQHIKNYYLTDISGQFISILNMFILLGQIKDSTIRHSYWRLIAQAWLQEDGRSDEYIRKCYSMKLARLIRFQMTEITPKRESPSSLKSERPFSALARLIIDQPAITENILALIQSVLWMPELEARTYPAFTPIKVDGKSYALATCTQPFEQLAIHSLQAWTHLKGHDTSIEQVFHLLGMRHIAFNETLRNQMVEVWMKMIPKRATSNESIRRFTEFLITDGQYDSQILEEWQIHSCFRYVIGRPNLPREIKTTLQIIHYRLKISRFNPSLEIIKQINISLIRLKDLLEDASIRNQLDKRYLNLIKNVVGPALTYMLAKRIPSSSIFILNELRQIFLFLNSWRTLSSLEEKILLLSMLDVFQQIPLNCNLEILYSWEEFWNSQAGHLAKAMEPYHVQKKIIETLLTQGTVHASHFNAPRAELQLYCLLEKVAHNRNLAEFRTQAIHLYLKLIENTVNYPHPECLEKAANLIFDLFPNLLLPSHLYASFPLLCERLIKTPSLSSIGIQLSWFLHEETPKIIDILLQAMQVSLLATPSHHSDNQFRTSCRLFASHFEIKKKYPIQQAQFEHFLARSFHSDSQLIREFILLMYPLFLSYAEETLSLCEAHRRLTRDDYQYCRHILLKARIDSGVQVSILDAYQVWLNQAVENRRIEYLDNGLKLLSFFLKKEEHSSKVAIVVEQLLPVIEMQSKVLPRWPLARIRETASILTKGLRFILRSHEEHSPDFHSCKLVNRLWMAAQNASLVLAEVDMPPCVLLAKCIRPLSNVHDYRDLEKLIDYNKWNLTIAKALISILKMNLSRAISNENEFLNKLIRYIFRSDHFRDMTSKVKQELLLLLIENEQYSLFGYLWETIDSLDQQLEIIPLMLKGISSSKSPKGSLQVMEWIGKQDLLSHKAFSDELRMTCYCYLFKYLAGISQLKDAPFNSYECAHFLKQQWVRIAPLRNSKARWNKQPILCDALITVLLHTEKSDNIKAACKLYYRCKGGGTPVGNASALLTSSINSTLCIHRSSEFQLFLLLIIRSLKRQKLITQHHKIQDVMDLLKTLRPIKNFIIDADQITQTQFESIDLDKSDLACIHPIPSNHSLHYISILISSIYRGMLITFTKYLVECVTGDLAIKNMDNFMIIAISSPLSAVSAVVTNVLEGHSLDNLRYLWRKEFKGDLAAIGTTAITQLLMSQFNNNYLPSILGSIAAGRVAIGHEQAGKRRLFIFFSSLISLYCLDLLKKI